MKIDGSSGAKDLGSATGIAAGTTRKSGTAGGVAAAKDAVSLSDLSAQLQELEARLSAEPAFDAGRVEQIKDAIRSGNFQVNAEAVAEGLISSVQDLLAKPRA